jgi:hypothetical protein
LLSHFNARLSAVRFAKLKACPTTGQQEYPFSMASLQRRYGNQHRIDRIVDPLAMEGMVDKFSSAAEELCHYGTIDDMTAEILSGILLVMK